jgi:4-hydroxy-3-methylbut-2-en-1-yl diphosphate synthase IspG/GcpE
LVDGLGDGVLLSSVSSYQLPVTSETSVSSNRLPVTSEKEPLTPEGELDSQHINTSIHQYINTLTLQHVNSTAFGILQAARTRMSKTEYISCPSCGRTLFDLQETTAMIRKRTDHLKGIKIGIMGCIVNGPGEMADADYGYVGVGKDKIALYKGKEVIKKAVPASDALDELIEIIREDGNWIEN